MKTLIVILIIAVALVACANPTRPTITFPAGDITGPHAVDRIIDGDTIDVRLRDGSLERVRLIGVNTPERNEPHADTATAFTSDLVRGERVFLALDEDEDDRYGRLLAYVFVPSRSGAWVAGRESFRMVNHELLLAGWAVTMRIPPNTRHASLFAEAERSARERRVGLFAP